MTLTIKQGLNPLHGRTLEIHYQYKLTYLVIVTLGAAYNQDNSTPEPGKLFNSIYDPSIANYKILQYLWFGKQSKLVDFSILFLNDGKQATDSSLYFTHTFGLNPSIKIKKVLKFFGSIYYQIGKDKVGRDVNAYLGSANISYSGIKTLTTVLGIDYVSGSIPQDLINKKKQYI